MAWRQQQTVYSTVIILGLSLNFWQFDKPVASKLCSLAGKPHLSDNLEQPNLPLHHHRTQAEQLIYSILRLRSQATKPTPMLLSIRAAGAGIGLRTILALLPI